MNYIDAFVVADSAYCDLDTCIPAGLNLQKNIKIISQNIRSINKNINEFEIALARTRVQWDLVALTECWIQGADTSPSLQGYDCYMTKNNRLQNDGVVFYVNKNIHATVDEHFITDANCLQISIERHTIVLAIYRSPSAKDIAPFLQSLNDILVKIDNTSNIVMIGDLNINIAENSQDPNKSQYLTLLATFGLLPAHTLPTRLTSCLDHILLKSKSAAKALVAQSTITDHDTIILFLSTLIRKAETRKTTKLLNIEQISSELSKFDFLPLYHLEDPNTALDLLISSIKKIIESNTKVNKVPNRKKILKPWVTPGLLRCLKNKDRMHKKLKKEPDNVILALSYPRYRNYCTQILKQLKKEYHQRELLTSRKNTKALWQSINKITNRSQYNNSATDLLSLASTPEQSVDLVNNFFINTGKTLAENIHQSFPKFTTIQNTPCHSLMLLPTDVQEVTRVVMSLRTDCAVGWDNIPANIIKQNIHILAPPLTHIFNLSLNKGIFPKAFKRAIIHPIYKASNRDQVTNYRPIAVLPSLAKILERIMNIRLKNYLEKNNLLSTSQYGFRAGKSTDNSVHELTDYMVKKLDEGQKVLAIFLDLAKAFDTVSVDILIEKMVRMGIRGTQLQLFEDFLCDRTQRVKIDEYLSAELTTTHGIPQGSALAPTLFLIYINDLCTLSLRDGKIFTFADDTALVFHSDTWPHVYNTAQIGFDAVAVWLRTNILTLNAHKTKYIPFAIRNPPPMTTDHNIIAHTCPHPYVVPCSCELLERRMTVKYLGVILDSSLSFRPHVESLTSRIRKLIPIFKNLKDVADEDLRRIVYFTLCQSLLTYCISTWGGTHKNCLLQLERAQRAILKVSYSLPFRHPTEELYKQSKVLTVRQLFILHSVLKYHSLFTYTSPSRQNKRRQNPDPSRPRFHSRFANRFFGFLGEYVYKKINKILNIYHVTKSICKIRLTEWLLTLDYYKTENLITVLT